MFSIMNTVLVAGIESSNDLKLPLIASSSSSIITIIMNKVRDHSKITPEKYVRAIVFGQSMFNVAAGVEDRLVEEIEIAPMGWGVFKEEQTVDVSNEEEIERATVVMEDGAALPFARKKARNQ